MSLVQVSSESAVSVSLYMRSLWGRYPLTLSERYLTLERIDRAILVNSNLFYRVTFPLVLFVSYSGEPFYTRNA
jgi:hypothetical protein